MKDLSAEELVRQHDHNTFYAYQEHDYSKAIKSREVLISRLKAGERAVKAMDELNKRISDLEAKLQEAEEMVKNLKCCGNCKKRFAYNCPKPADEHLEGTGKHRFDNTPNVKCEAWQSDNRTQEERKC